MKLTLISSDKIHTYKDEEGNVCTIEAGKQEWTWKVGSKSKKILKNYRNIIETFVKQGIKQHDYAGGFKEAINVLEIKNI